MLNPISTRVTQFDYFDEILGHPRWRGKKILDFGGNAGVLLKGAGDEIDHADYCCMDVGRAAIEHGRRTFPRANFVHFDRYSSEFNPDGARYLPIPDVGKFDLVLCFSVFTHIDRTEMVELVDSLRRLLAPGGTLAFTFCDARYDRSLSNPDLPKGSDVRKVLEWSQARNTAADIDRLVERAMRAQWCVVIDEEVYCDSPGDELSHQVRTGRAGESYGSYFTVDFMQSLFPDATIHDPVPPEWQHCCVLECGGKATAFVESRP